MSEEKTTFGLEVSEYKKLFDILNKYASGVQPAEVGNEFQAMSSDTQQAIAPLALIAAIGARRTIEQDSVIQGYIQKVPIVRTVLNDKFMISNRVNFTKLYMLGNLLMQSGSFDDVQAVRNYQTKIKGKSLLTSDANTANLSDQKKNIIRGQVGKYNINEFTQAAIVCGIALTRERVIEMLKINVIKDASSSSSSSAAGSPTPIGGKQGQAGAGTHGKSGSTQYKPPVS